MNDYNVGYKTRWKLKLVGNELPLFDGVCKWVENANQTQLKPMIWYTSWYFSRGGGGKKNSRGWKKFIDFFNSDFDYNCAINSSSGNFCIKL